MLLVAAYFVNVGMYGFVGYKLLAVSCKCDERKITGANL
jgi:hypothetical protein